MDDGVIDGMSWTLRRPSSRPLPIIPTHRRGTQERVPASTQVQDTASPRVSVGRGRRNLRGVVEQSVGPCNRGSRPLKWSRITQGGQAWRQQKNR